MKLISLLVLLNMFLVSFAYTSTKSEGHINKKEMRREYFKKKMINFNNSRKKVSNKVTSKYDKLVCIDKGSKASHYISPDQKKAILKSTVEEKKSFVKKLFKAFFGKIQISQMDSDNENELKIKLESKKDKYLVRRIDYKLNSIISKTYSIDTTEEGEDIIVKIDISELPVGEFKAYFKFIYEKANKKKNNFYSTYGYGLFEKKEKLVNILANIEITHDENFGYVRVDTSTSTSDAGDIVNFSYVSYKNGVEFNRFTSEYPVQYIVFQEQGQFEIQVEIEDSAGNKALTEKRTVQITNATPNIQFSVTEVPEFNGHYLIDASASSDFEDGKNILFRYVLYTTNLQGGFEIYIDHYTKNAKYSIAVPEGNKEYTLTVIGFDSTDQSGSGGQELLNYVGDSIAPKLVGHYISTDELFANVKYIGAAFASKRAIVEYVYTVTHEDGESVPLFEPLSAQENAVELTKPGLWTYEFYGIDEDGTQSDKVKIIENNTWSKEDFVPVGIWNNIDVSGHDPRIQYIYTGFEDKFGEVVNYSYTKAEHVDGTQIQALDVNFSDIAKEFRFPKKGTYNFTVVATDNDGNRSIPYSFSHVIDWGDFKPIADFVVQPSPTDPKNVEVVLVNSRPSQDVTHILKATHESGSELNLEFAGNFTSFQLDKFGTWSLEYRIRDIFGITSDPKLVVYEAIRTEIDGDFIPPIPNKELNDSTLAGIDSDNDGVRDDVERIVNKKFSEPEIRIAHKKLSKNMREELIFFESGEFDLLSEDERKNYLNKNLDAVGCFSRVISNNSTVNKNRDYLAELLKAQYNTIERMKRLYKIEGYSGGLEFEYNPNLNCE